MFLFNTESLVYDGCKLQNFVVTTHLIRNKKENLNVFYIKKTPIEFLYCFL